MRKVIILCALAAGCGEGTPDNPTWADVQPILMANCARCHGGSDPIGAAPTTFRLDIPYEVFEDQSTRHQYGAAAMSQFAVARACDKGDMPPVGPHLSGRQCDILRTWAATQPYLVCGPDDTQGLCGRAPNAAPTALLLSNLTAADANIDIVVLVSDPDRDQVNGVLRWTAGDEGVITERLHEGRNEVLWDTSAVPPGTYSITAQVANSDPPFDTFDYDLGQVQVQHAGGDTPPRASFAPSTGARPLYTELLTDADSPFGIQFQVTDPDVGDAVTLDVDAVAGAQVIPIAADVPAAAGPALQTVPWDLTATPAGPSWRIRVTAGDGSKTSTWFSEPFAVAHGTTTVTCAQASDVFVQNCSGCHGPVGSAAAVVFNGPDFTGNLCDPVSSQAIGSRGLIYRRVILLRDMPPRSAGQLLGQSPMSEADRETLRSWLEGGTPTP